MKKLFTCVLVILFAVGAGLTAASFAQDELTNYGYGKVVSVTGNSITISEAAYDEDLDEETYQETTYTVTEDADLENISSVGAFEGGEEVDIEYIEKDGKRQINYIYVYTSEE